MVSHSDGTGTRVFMPGRWEAQAGGLLDRPSLMKIRIQEPSGAVASCYPLTPFFMTQLLLGIPMLNL